MIYQRVIQSKEKPDSRSLWEKRKRQDSLRQRTSEQSTLKTSGTELIPSKESRFCHNFSQIPVETAMFPVQEKSKTVSRENSYEQEVIKSTRTQLEGSSMLPGKHHSFTANSQLSRVGIAHPTPALIRQTQPECKREIGKCQSCTSPSAVLQLMKKEKVGEGYQREIDFDPEDCEEIPKDARAAYGGGKWTGEDGLMYAWAITKEGEPCLCTQGKRATSMTNQPGSFPRFGGQYNLPYKSKFADWTKCLKVPNDEIGARILSSDKQSKEDTQKVIEKTKKIRDGRLNQCEKKSGKSKENCEIIFSQQFKYLDEVVEDENK